MADEQRAAELARMMAGLEATESALAHAGELVELAARPAAPADRLGTAGLAPSASDQPTFDVAGCHR